MSFRFVRSAIPIRSRAEFVLAFIDALRARWTGELVATSGDVRPFTLAPSAQTEFLSFEIAGAPAVRMLLLEAGPGTFTACALGVLLPGTGVESAVVLQGRRTGTQLEGTYVIRDLAHRRQVSEGTFRAVAGSAAHRAA